MTIKAQCDPTSIPSLILLLSTICLAHSTPAIVLSFFVVVGHGRHAPNSEALYWLIPLPKALLCQTFLMDRSHCYFKPFLKCYLLNEAFFLSNSFQVAISL